MAPVAQPVDDRVVRFAGRLFSRFSIQTGVYCVPVDESEETRLDELNRILREVLTRTVLAPFPPTGVREPAVLDCGFGKAAWIDSLLYEFEQCEVTGIDVFLGSGAEDSDSPESESSDDDEVQEFIKKRWNLNASFREDRSSSRLGRDRFHLINSRLVAEGINADRWPAYIDELRLMLRPGGWLQMVELDLLVQSWNGTLAEDSCLRRWWNLYKTAMSRMNKNPQISRHLGSLMRQSGFESVAAGSVDLPIGGWNPRAISMGTDNRAVMMSTIEAVSLWPFTGRPMGAPPMVDEARYALLIQGARRELMDDRLKLYYRAYVGCRTPPDRHQTTDPIAGITHTGDAALHDVGDQS